MVKIPKLVVSTLKVCAMSLIITDGIAVIGIRIQTIEALLKRCQGRKFEPIEPLVDVYNSISLSYGVPVGIEDRNKIAGNLHLGVAKGGEAFRPVGAEL